MQGVCDLWSLFVLSEVLNVAQSAYSSEGAVKAVVLNLWAVTQMLSDNFSGSKDFAKTSLCLAYLHFSTVGGDDTPVM